MITIKQWYVNWNGITFHKKHIKELMINSKFSGMLKVMTIMKITEYSTCSSHGEFCLQKTISACHKSIDMHAHIKGTWFVMLILGALILIFKISRFNFSI